jgi:hypothetical protein
MKLGQKGKLFPMFQFVSLQNLVNFGHGEGHCFEFQNLDVRKSLKL